MIPGSSARVLVAFGWSSMDAFNTWCKMIYIYTFLNVGIYKYMHTRILGPPKAGDEKRRKTLIWINLYFGKILIFEKNLTWGSVFGYCLCVCIISCYFACLYEIQCNFVYI